MKLRYTIPATVLSALFVASVASAQVSSGVNVGISPTTSTVTPGSGQTVATLTLTGGQNGVSITSIPLTFTPGNGAAVGNLSNCQVYNSAGQSITTGANLLGTIGVGGNTFNLNAPLNVSANTGTTTLTVRCDVAANTPTGGTFSLSAGNLGFTSGLLANLDTAPSVPRGSQDVALANIFVGGNNSGTNVNIANLPVSITAGNGATAAHLSDCRIRNTANLSGSLSGSINPAGGTTQFGFSTPLTVLAGGSNMLALTCDVNASTPIGGTFTISITPSAIAATNAATGATITPTAVVGVGPNGLPAATSGTVIVSASTGTGGTGGNGTGGTGTGGTGTPGIPNTGAGAQAAIIMGFAALLALLGSLYLRQRTA